VDPTREASVAVEGLVAPGFRARRNAFERSFRDGFELGAASAAVRGSEKLVDPRNWPKWSGTFGGLAGHTPEPRLRTDGYCPLASGASQDNTDLDQLRNKIADRMEPLRLHLYVAQRLESILTDRVAKWQEVDTARAIAPRDRQAGSPGLQPGAGD
jgi:hypothetical protein